MNNEVKSYVEEKMLLVQVGKFFGQREFEERAAAMLEACAIMTNFRQVFSEQLIKAKSVHSAMYKQELDKATGKTITENKIAVEAVLEYQQAREAEEMAESAISYVKAYYDIFNNAHVFYRNMLKDNNAGR